MLEILLKLVLAIVLGGLIGLEREFSHKPAGLRTNIMICVGSAMMMILSEVMLGGKGTSAGDALRIAAGVITGMGFIGAGTIIQSRGVVHGLTTASTLWAVTGLGLVIGAGYYLIALIFSGLVILTLILFRAIEESLPKKSQYFYRVRVQEHPDIQAELERMMSAFGIRLEDVAVKKERDACQVEFHFQSPPARERSFAEKLKEFGDILEYKIDL